MKFVRILIGAVSLAMSASAPGPAATTPSATPPAPSGGTTDPKILAAADRLIAVAGLAGQFDALVPKIIDLMMPTIVPGNTGREAELRRILSEEFVTSFGRTRPLIIGKARELYAARFTAEELNALADFYVTPLGKKSLTAGSEIQVEMFAFGQQAGKAAAQDAMPRIIERMRRANFKLPQGV